MKAKGFTREQAEKDYNLYLCKYEWIELPLNDCNILLPLIL